MSFRLSSTVSLALALATYAAPARAATVTLDIEARIEGIDRLLIRDGTLQWEHQRTSAERTAANVKGVKGVSNAILLSAPADLDCAADGKRSA